MTLYTHATFYITDTEGFRYVFTTGVDGISDNVTITYEALDHETGEYVKKDMKEITLPYNDFNQLFVELVKKAQEYADWSRQFD